MSEELKQAKQAELNHASGFILNALAEGKFKEGLFHVLEAHAQQAYRSGAESRHLQRLQGELVLSNQKTKAEILRIAGTDIFVDGEKTTDMGIIGAAVIRWATASQAEAPVETPAKGKKKGTMKAVK